MQVWNVFLCTQEECITKNGEFSLLMEKDGVTYGTCRLAQPADECHPPTPTPPVVGTPE